MSAPATPPIIIIKKKGGHGGHHGGAWKVAYADFVTAMMAFFIVMWLLSSTEEVRKAIAGYFRDPKGHGAQMGSSMGGNGPSVTLTKNSMDKLKDKLQEAIKKSPQFEKMKNYVEMTITGEGLRIELLETEKGMFFESGQPVPTGLGKELLEKLAHELGTMQNTILVEGHTDAAQYQGAQYSNWELSADRANAARKIMQEAGLRADQVTQVRGFADQQLRQPDKPDDPSNRRVTIIVQFPDAPEAPPAKGGKEGEEGAAKGEEGKEGAAKEGASKEGAAKEGEGKKAEGHADAAKPPDKSSAPTKDAAKPPVKAEGKK
jgi:chemotaxis protein MotB